MGSQQHLEQLYRQAIYEVDLPGGTVAFQVGTPADAVLTLPLVVITAWNPGLERPGDSATGQRTAASSPNLSEGGSHSSPPEVAMKLALTSSLRSPSWVSPGKTPSRSPIAPPMV